MMAGAMALAAVGCGREIAVDVSEAPVRAPGLQNAETPVEVLSVDPGVLASQDDVNVCTPGCDRETCVECQTADDCADNGEHFWVCVEGRCARACAYNEQCKDFDVCTKTWCDSEQYYCHLERCCYPG
jgi:hypothetical protein